jgi:hypothetical protein
VIELAEKDARLMSKRLAREEGIFSGMSSGGAAHAAIKLSEELGEGVIVFIVCDRGDRYLSSDLSIDPSLKFFVENIYQSPAFRFRRFQFHVYRDLIAGRR